MTGPGGAPRCRYAAISWTDDQSTLPCGGANPYYGANVCLVDLASPPSTPPGFTNEQTYQYITADVAAVETLNTGLYVAYLALADISGNILEWEVDNLSSSPTSGPLNYLAGGMDIYPRIAAIDNINYNDYSLLGTNNAWMVVANTNSGTKTVNGYYGVAAGTYGVSLAGIWTVNSVYPRVAWGKDIYTVAYDMDDLFGSYVTTDMAWNTAMTTPVNYNCVNYTGITTTAGLQQNTISWTCNNDGNISWPNQPKVLGAWYNDNPGQDVYYKDALSIGGWKPGRSATSIGNSKAFTDWSVSPNPAATSVTLSIPENVEKASYNISDITGRILMHGLLNSSKEKLDISQLAAGLYLIHLYDKTIETGILKFVKE